MTPSSSAPGRTGSRRRSRSPGRGGRVLVLEAAETDRRRLPDARADAARLPPRRLLRDPPARASSPFFRDLPLAEHGLEWSQPPAPLAHPLDDGTAVVLERSRRRDRRRRSARTAPRGGACRAARRSMPTTLVGETPRRRSSRAPPPAAARALRAARASARRRGWPGRRFEGERARALFAGLAGALDPAARALADGLVRAAARDARPTPSAGPWPRGGSQAIADALASYLRSLGGEIRTSTAVASVDDLPPARAVLLDVSPRAAACGWPGTGCPTATGAACTATATVPAVFKVDWALDGPIPWAAPECARAGTVHLGGTLDEIAAAERAPFERPARRSGPTSSSGSRASSTDSRAPAGKHTVWAYCHVPNGSDGRHDGADRGADRAVRTRLPRRGCSARHVMAPARPRGLQPELRRRRHRRRRCTTLRQLVFRPAVPADPVPTPARGIYLCSSSTPPGGGVHGMCGYYAAKAALRAD